MADFLRHCDKCGAQTTSQPSEMLAAGWISTVLKWIYGNDELWKCPSCAGRSRYGR